MTEEEFIEWLKDTEAIRIILMEIVGNVGGVETTFYLASSPYSSDTTEYRPVLIGGVTFTENIAIDGSSAGSGGGDIEIDNLDASLDIWIQNIWKNRSVKMWIGDLNWARSEFQLIFDGITDDIEFSGDDKIIFKLMNKLDRLNKAATEAKLGGLTQNKDQYLPVVLGEVFNMSPLLIDTNQTYQVHNGPIEAIIEVRDNGAPRTDITTDLANGKFQITGNAVVGTITASVQGYKDGTYYDDVANLVQVLVTEFGPAEGRFDPSEIDSANFAAISAAYPQPVGLVVRDGSTVLSLCQELTASIGAQLICTTLGKLRIVPLRLPITGTPLAVGQADMVLDSVFVSERSVVKAGCKLGYCKNWSPQSSGLATGLPAVSADNLGKEWWTVSATNAAVATLYKLTEEDIQEDTLLLKESDAQTECTRRKDFFSVQRNVYRATYFEHMMLKQLGDPLNMTFRRYGLAAGKDGMLVSAERDWLGLSVTIGMLA